MYSLHNSTAISLSALSLIADLITCRIWHEESPSYRHWILMPIRLDGRLFPLAVLTSHCIFLCVCVCAGFIISWRIRKEICLHHCTQLCSQLADTSVICCAIECVVWHRCFLPVVGASADTEKGEFEWARVWGEWEKRVEENWGFLWSPLSRSTEQSGDQSGLFYVAGVILWSLRVTYSTHFIKFTSVLIADQ